MVQDIQVDAKNKKIFIEIEKKGVEAFDYLFIEAHPLSAILNEKKIKLFPNNFKLNYAWMGVAFEIDFLKPIEDFKSERTFFIVLDSLRNSIIDNWFFCHFTDRQLNVWGFLPLHQVNNPEFKNFYVDRIREFVAKKFEFIHLKNYINSYLSTAGADSKSTSLRYRPAQAVPNFMFWSTQQVTKYFENEFSKKMKSFKKDLEVSV